ncbi:hypothetical protein K0B96_10605 [Horticoccus luteus]|uniref:Uncharacterized protein n=1 Tax=Horticoccus luteus TaxID=2862869 RepID=A0A8F9TT18_9BACT|nr:hypothetical protein [Horticoccus luteus]QYM77773.1 hypothetical protein K0B96_10605 [Horticoccus luteus]
MTRRRLAALVLAVAALLAVWFWLRPAPTSPVASRAPSSAPGATAIARPASPPPLDEDTGLAALAQLGSPATTISADLQLLDGMFTRYQSNFRGNPVGLNAEIVATLTGGNPLHLAFISPHHPALNARGELCDRWGTPFFFHQLSGTRMEIRSAGPDRKMWTADDSVLTP